MRSSGVIAALRDELGDLLFQVVFHARMAEENGLFVSPTSLRRSSIRWCAAIPMFLAMRRSPAPRRRTRPGKRTRRRSGPPRPPRQAPRERARRRRPGVPCPAPRHQDPAPRGADRLRLAERTSGHRQARRGDRRTRSRDTPTAPPITPASRTRWATSFRRRQPARKLDIDPEAALRRATKNSSGAFAGSRHLPWNAASATNSMRSKRYGRRSSA